MQYIVSKLFLACIIFGVSFEQTLPEGTTDRTTVCQGSPLRGSCTSNELIAVKDIKYGTKLTATCSSSDTSAGCCDYDSADCLTQYTDTSQQTACSGKELCTGVTISQEDTSSCGETYPDLNHYLTMEYYCIPDSRVSSTCPGASVSKTTTGSLLYLHNTDYPNPIRATETSCSCSVQASSCSSQIKVYFVHFQLDDGGGSCTDTQQFQIDDEGNSHAFTCSDNTDYTMAVNLTSTSNYITATLSNTAGTNAGYMWIGFEATDGREALVVDCPATAQTRCIDCPSLPSPSHGSVSLSSGLAYSSQATYSCDNGYDLQGSITRTCQADGSWDALEPACSPVECPVLSNPGNGAVSLPGGRTYTQQATYSCSNGFTLNGFATTTCQANGTWSNPPPTCDMSSTTPSTNSGGSTGSSGSGSGSSGTSGSGQKQQPTDPGDNGLSGGAMAGIIVGCIAFVAVIVLGIAYIKHRYFHQPISPEKLKQGDNVLKDAYTLATKPNVNGV